MTPFLAILLPVFSVIFMYFVIKHLYIMRCDVREMKVMMQEAFDKQHRPHNDFDAHTQEKESE
ncbi:hypothetical protein G7061_05185 [Erysipelothrix sp. HDW6B]|uniref:hypothetical protein n=1 Tax=Erysipelothrix TaxID=1647 RepID=UPI00135797DB|nr:MULTISPECIES: hypothetical protein [Erysipelothrix]QIK86030.1 hypothetical protein G7061_05185 [Erysipelothrix sp. HDW6B]